MFSGIKYVPILDLAPSQLYLNEAKLKTVQQWLDPKNLAGFVPLQVHDFGDGHLTLIDGHSRAYAACLAGIWQVPVEYYTGPFVTSEIGRLQYERNLLSCRRVGLHSICDLAHRIVSAERYEELWVERCDKVYDLLTRTTEAERKNLQALRPSLFLYGASEDLKNLYFENEKGETFLFPTK